MMGAMEYPGASSTFKRSVVIARQRYPRCFAVPEGRLAGAGNPETGAAVRVGASNLCVGRHPVIGVRVSLLGGQQRQYGGQRVHRKGLSGRETQVLTANLK